MLAPMQSLLQLRDSKRVLAALEFAGLVELQPANGGLDHSFHERAVWLPAIFTAPKLAVLPHNLDASTDGAATGRVAIIVEAVYLFKLLSHVLTSSLCVGGARPVAPSPFARLRLEGR